LRTHSAIGEKNCALVKSLRRGNLGQAIGEVIESALEIVNGVARDERNGFRNGHDAHHSVDGLPLISPVRMVMGVCTLEHPELTDLTKMPWNSPVDVRAESTDKKSRLDFQVTTLWPVEFWRPFGEGPINQTVSRAKLMNFIRACVKRKSISNQFP
jgi:hypothetical protein